MKKIQKVCIVNIIANDYLPNQTIFVEKLLKTNKKINLFCISLENNDFKSSLFKTIKLSEINTINNYHELTFKYNALELSTAVKPYAIKWLMTEYGYDKVLYFDSDILVYKSLKMIIQALDDHEVVLTPHIRHPIQDDKSPGDMDISRAGYYNLGFIAFQQTKQSLLFLDWWSTKVANYCYIDFDKHYFVDQRWIDFAPLFLDAYIIREPGYNVAYFNLQEYVDKFDPNQITFMHFSGFNIDLISAYQTRFSPVTVKEYYRLFQEYNNKLAMFNHTLKRKKYRYANFANGTRINSLTRKFLLDEIIYAELKSNHVDLSNPFLTSRSHSYYSYLTSLRPETPVIQAVYFLYQLSPYIQSKFPLIVFNQWNQQLADLISWFIKIGAKDYNFPPQFLTQQVLMLKNIKPFLESFSSSSDELFLIKFRRVANFINIIRLRSKLSFLTNIYLFFLLRMPDIESIAAMQKFTGPINAYKQQVVLSILFSTEYKTQKSPKIYTTMYWFMSRVLLTF